MNKFLASFTNVMKWMPYILAGIETVHEGASTETKTQLAQDALTVATAAATANLSPDEAHIAQAVSAAASTTIQAVQQGMDAVKTPPPAAPNP